MSDQGPGDRALPLYRYDTFQSGTRITVVDTVARLDHTASIAQSSSSLERDLGPAIGWAFVMSGGWTMPLKAEVEIQCTVRVDGNRRQCRWKLISEDMDEAFAMHRAHGERMHTNADGSPRS